MSAANRVLQVEGKSEKFAEKPDLIATPFGDLTRDEIREWEKMLGRRLLRLPKPAPEN